MPGGLKDSSRTRVAPVFDHLRSRSDDWVRKLLSLAEGGHPSAGVRSELDLSCVQGHWAPNELALRPPVSLLSWLIRNANGLDLSNNESTERRLLYKGDQVTISRALQLLRTENANRGWYVFEGPTYPDAVIETPDAIVVVEGKRTEPGATTKTTWLPGRHQIWRHVDAAWEIKGRRTVYGLFVVESGGEAVEDAWQKAAKYTLANDTLDASFPHRGKAERDDISKSFVGVVTWRAICSAFALPYDSLPNTLADLHAPA